LARTFSVDEHLTQGFVGTAPYSSPEQAACSECDNRSDLFSLGCVLYLMVTGQQPFIGPRRRDFLMQVKTHLPPPAAVLAPAIPADLSWLIEQLLAKEPARRPASAEEVVSSLSRLIEREVGSRDARLPVSGDPTDPHLADVLGAWPVLTASIRGAIVTLINGCSSQPVAR
jgi:serine/threonine protein kinase